jgi:undecaprenyl-diphosphatase
MHANFGWLDALILGLVQGLTEFLPISSSAHLRILGPLLPGHADQAQPSPPSPMGTELAVLIYFRKDVWRMLTAWLASLP